MHITHGSVVTTANGSLLPRLLPKDYLLLDIYPLIGAFGKTGLHIKLLRHVTSGWGLVYRAVALA